MSTPSTTASAPYPHPIIAREGWGFIAGFALLALLTHGFVGWLWALPLWLLTLFTLQFFRDPPRPVATANQGRAVVSAADGRVVFVGEADDPYLARRALKISVFMNVFNVHSNRSPVDGVVVQTWYMAGSFLNAALDKASLENERSALHIRLDDGADVTCVQIAGLVARRIINYAKSGDRLRCGQRYGLIRFGSRVDHYLPLSARAAVVIGDKVSASATLLAELP